MKRTLYLFSNGSLKRKGNTLYFENSEEATKKYLPVENINEILVFGEIDLNKKLLEFLCQKEIIVHFFNHYGYYAGSFYPREHYNSGYMLLKQVEYYLDYEKRFTLAHAFVEGALKNMLKVIAYYNSRGIKLEDKLEQLSIFKKELANVKSIEHLMAIEGNSKEAYYSAFDSIIASSDFCFGGRSKKPPKNELNALISFGNTLVYVLTLSEIYKTHLDPRIGYLHSTNFRRFTLNLDVAEIFKPILSDRLIFGLLNKGMIKKKHFEPKLNGLYLKENGRRIFIEEFDNRLKTTIKHTKLKRNVSYRQLVRLDLYKLEKHLIGEKSFTPFIARW